VKDGKKIKLGDSCELLKMFILSEVSVIYHDIHNVREEHWAANQSHAVMVEVSDRQKSYICCLCLPGMDVQKVEMKSKMRNQLR